MAKLGARASMRRGVDAPRRRTAPGATRRALAQEIGRRRRFTPPDGSGHSDSWRSGKTRDCAATRNAIVDRRHRDAGSTAPSGRARLRRHRREPQRTARRKRRRAAAAERFGVGAMEGIVVGGRSGGPTSGLRRRDAARRWSSRSGAGGRATGLGGATGAPGVRARRIGWVGRGRPGRRRWPCARSAPDRARPARGRVGASLGDASGAARAESRNCGAATDRSLIDIAEQARRRMRLRRRERHQSTAWHICRCSRDTCRPRRLRARRARHGSAPRSSSRARSGRRRSPCG